MPSREVRREPRIQFRRVGADGAPSASPVKVLQRDLSELITSEAVRERRLAVR